MYKLVGQHSYVSGNENCLITEEPDEGNLHVRICGGPGWVTAGSTRIQQFGYGLPKLWEKLQFGKASTKLCTA